MTFFDILRQEQEKDYFKNLTSFLDKEYNEKEIYPPRSDLYKAFELTPFDKIQVVLVGQDPYPTIGYAMGLSFSVNDGVKIPKSLQNIFKELNKETGFKIPESGNLTAWALNGVLLINLILSVEKDNPLSHKNKGWETFTYKIIEEINKLDQKIVFILLGNEAQKLTKYLNNPKHLILCTSHPSPLGAYKGFFGSNVFLQTMQYLNNYNIWRIDNENKN